METRFSFLSDTVARSDEYRHRKNVRNLHSQVDLEDVLGFKVKFPQNYAVQLKKSIYRVVQK